MKCVLMGYREYSFKDQQDGHQVEGISLFTAFNSDGVEGQETAKVSVSLQGAPKNLADYLGVELDVDFDSKGRVRQVIWPKPVTASAPAGGSGSSSKG